MQIDLVDCAPTANKVVNFDVRCRTVGTKSFTTLKIAARHKSALVLRLVIGIPTFLVLSFVNIHPFGWDDLMAFGYQLLYLIRCQWNDSSKAFKLCPFLCARVLQTFLYIWWCRLIVDTFQDLLAFFFKAINSSHETGKHGIRVLNFLYCPLRGIFSGLLKVPSQGCWEIIQAFIRIRPSSRGSGLSWCCSRFLCGMFAFQGCGFTPGIRKGGSPLAFRLSSFAGFRARSHIPLRTDGSACSAPILVGRRCRCKLFSCIGSF